MFDMYVNVIKQSRIIISAFWSSCPPVFFVGLILLKWLLSYLNWSVPTSSLCFGWILCSNPVFSKRITARWMQHWPHKTTTHPHAQSSVSFICTLYLCRSCQPVLDLLVTLFLSPTWAFCPRFGCSGWVLLKPAEQRGSKLLQHLFLCYACGATVGFLSNSFRQ